MVLRQCCNTGGGAGQATSLVLETSGAGTDASPYSACNLLHTNQNGTINRIDNRQLIHFFQGQAGELSADGVAAQQPRFIVPSGHEIELVKVVVTLGEAGESDTVIEAFITNNLVNGQAPDPGAADCSLTISSGITHEEWGCLEGTVLTSQQHLQSRVATPGTGSESLTIHYYGKTCVGI